MRDVRFSFSLLCRLCFCLAKLASLRSTFAESRSVWDVSACLLSLKPAARALNAQGRSPKDEPWDKRERKTSEIGFAVLRGGDVVGEHKVLFSNIGERLELAHKATDRSIFAYGALRASSWATKASPGLYSLLDVLKKGG